MNPEQYSSYEESLALCNKLIDQLKDDCAQMRRCVHGDLLKAYERATERAISEVERVKKDLRSIQQ